MRKTSALLALLVAAAALSVGCSASSPNQTTSNSTTTNSNASSPPRQSEGGSYANTNSRPPGNPVGATPPAPSGGKPTSIKPPMKNDNK